MTIASVYRSVSILATATSQLEGNVYSKNQNVAHVSWITQPDPLLTGPAFFESTVTSLALHGNAFWRVWRNQRQEVITVRVLPPDEVSVGTRDGKPVYTYGNKEYDQTQIRHLALLRMPGQLRGLGPVQASRYELEAQLALQSYQNNWFNGGGIPQGVLTTDQVLNSKMADDYEARWNEKLANSNTPILGSGLKYSPLLLNPKDALFLEIANYGVAEIARLFGIPNAYLGVGIEGSSLTYSSAVDQDIQFLRYTLSAYLVEIEQAITALLPRRLQYKYDTAGLLRTADKTRYESYEIAIRSGWLTTEEVREKEGLDPSEVTSKVLQLESE